MKAEDILREIKFLSPDELLFIKNSIIDDVDKRKYSKDILSNMDKRDAISTIQWIKLRYDI